MAALMLRFAHPRFRAPDFFDRLEHSAPRRGAVRIGIREEAVGPSCGHLLGLIAVFAGIWIATTQARTG